MDYSPIKVFKIRNFRQLKSVDIVFDTPIITLVGENDAGKTSVILALAVCGLNAFATKQKKYIQRGANAFGLGMGLADGTEIQRIKSKSTQNLLTISKGEKIILNLTKFDNPSLQPVELEKVMGLLKDSSTGEILNIRTYHNKLIFAETTAGDNYKIIYEMLKVSNLVRALRRGNEEASDYKKKINNNAILIEHTLNSLREIKDINIEPLLISKQTILSKKNTYITSKRCIELKKEISKINTSSISQIQSLVSINIETYNNLQNAVRAKNSIESISNKQALDLMDKVSLIASESVEKLKRCIDIQRYLQGLHIKSCSELETLLAIDSNTITQLEQAIIKKNQIKNIKDISLTADLIDVDVINKLNAIINTKNIIHTFDNELSKINSQIEELRDAIKESGINYKICSNCGEVVLMDDCCEVQNNV